MAHVLTEATTFDATVTVPDDGDAETAASVDGAFQSLTDRTRYLVHELTLFSQITQGQFISPPLIYCANNTSTIVISDARGLAFAGFQWPGSGASVLIPGTSNTLAGLLGGTPSHNTWYYLYADTAGAYHATAAAVPDSTQTFMGLTANVNQRYVGCCLTDNTGQVVPFTRSRTGRYVFRPSGGEALAFFNVMPGTAAPTTDTVAPLQASGGTGPLLLPPHALIVQLDVLLQNGGASLHSLYVASDTDATTNAIELFVDANSYAQREIELALKTSPQNITYRVDNVAVSPNVYVRGFQE